MKKLWLCLFSWILVLLCGCNTNNEQDLKFEFEMKEKCSKYDTEQLREDLSESIERISMYNIFYSKKYNSCLAYYNWYSHFDGLYEAAWVSMATFDIVTDIFSKKQLFKCWYHWASSEPYDSKINLDNKNDHQQLFLYYDNSFYENKNTFDNDCELIANDFITSIE